MKILSILLTSIIIILAGTTAVFAGFTAVVDSKEARVGETALIDIRLQDNSGIIAAKLKLEYDRERLELIEAADGDILDGAVFSRDYADYPYIMLWNSASGENFTTDGVLVTLTFKVRDNAKTGDVFIKLSYDPDDVFDVELNNVDMALSGGKITILSEKAYDEDIPIPDKAMPENTIILTVGEKRAIVFGEEKENDVAPVVRSERIMLPVRFVAENMGAAVDWNGEKNEVTIKKDGIVIVIVLDSVYAYVNGERTELDSPAFAENQRTYTPLRFIAENLGGTVLWNGAEVVIHCNS